MDSCLEMRRSLRFRIGSYGDELALPGQTFPGRVAFFSIDRRRIGKHGKIHGQAIAAKCENQKQAENAFHSNGSHSFRLLEDDGEDLFVSVAGLCLA